VASPVPISIGPHVNRVNGAYPGLSCFLTRMAVLFIWLISFSYSTFIAFPDDGVNRISFTLRSHRSGTPRVSDRAFIAAMAAPDDLGYSVPSRSR